MMVGISGLGSFFSCPCCFSKDDLYGIKSGIVINRYKRARVRGLKSPLLNQQVHKYVRLCYSSSGKSTSGKNVSKPVWPPSLESFCTNWLCLSRDDKYGSSCLGAFYSHTFAWLSFCRFTSSFIGYLTFLIIRILVLIISSQLKCSYSFQTCLLTLDTLIQNSFYLCTGRFLSTWHKSKHLERRTLLTWRIASFTLAHRQICKVGGHFLN